jgi:multiple sugar transport system permease protein
MIGRRWWHEPLWWVATLAVLAVFLAPVAWLILTSLKGPQDVTAYPPKIFFSPTLDNYTAVLSGNYQLRPGDYTPADPYFPRQLMNSAIASSVTVAVCLALGGPAAYALSRLTFRGKRDLAFFILGSRFVPPIAIVIPVFGVYGTLGLNNSLAGLILVYIAMNLGLVIWLLKGFFDEVPKEIDDAALVDGCGRFEAFWRVTLPIARAGFVATSILAVLFVWNEFLFALILTGQQTTTATVGLTTFIGGRSIAWGSLCAAGTIVTIPVFIMALLTQRHLVRGFTGGALHG